MVTVPAYFSFMRWMRNFDVIQKIKILNEIGEFMKEKVKFF